MCVVGEFGFIGIPWEENQEPNPSPSLEMFGCLQYMLNNAEERNAGDKMQSHNELWKHGVGIRKG